MRKRCHHCWHLWKGPIPVYVPPLHVVLVCCKCGKRDMEHINNLSGGPHGEIEGSAPTVPKVRGEG
jgi:hypothetical protein